MALQALPYVIVTVISALPWLTLALVVGGVFLAGAIVVSFAR